MTRTAFSFVVAFLIASVLAVPSAQSQHRNVYNGLYGKVGVGFSDYTGDFPIQNLGHPLDFQEFSQGSGFPFMLNGELGYHFSPKLALAVGIQGGNYPIVGYGGAGNGIQDSWRYTPHILGRYFFGNPEESMAFYLDGGLNATFGGATSTGFGPSVGGGVDFPLSDALSFYVESRFNFTIPDDAIDGSSNIGDTPASQVQYNQTKGSSTGPFDSVNQLLGFGVKYSFTTPVPPKVMSLNGPTSTQTGKSVKYTATINKGKASRPVSYQWTFGDGSTGSGMTASHTYSQPGTYTVTFTASNDVGKASESLQVEVKTPPQPAQIASVSANPNPVDEGETVRFSSNVSGDTPITRNWSFGDGSSATGKSPTHTYEEAGQYTARLQVSNEAGKDSRTVTVRVNRVLPEVCATIGELNSAFFQRNSSTLTEEAKSSLKENADVLSKCPNLTVQVEAFAAPGERSPQSLAKDRANAVADFYQSNGVPENRIQATGKGQVEGVTTKKGETRKYRRADSIPESEDGGM